VRYVRAVSVIWRKEEEEWTRLLPAGFPSEERLHDLIADSPSLLPLSGNPSVVVLGREVALGPGYADLVAVEADGRLVIIELKLQRNAEARRAVVAQILTYAAYLKGLGFGDLTGLLHQHLSQVEADSIVDAVAKAFPEFDESTFKAGVSDSLATGSFRLVLVLDDAPSELVQLVGYLESISSGVLLDLVTVSSYEVGDEQILVPQRVDPEYQREQAQDTGPGPSKAQSRREVDGSEAFEQAIARAPEQDRMELRRLLDWARRLEGEGLATLRTVLGDAGRQVLKVWVRGEKAGLTSIWNDGGAYLQLWRTMFVRLAWDHIATVEQILGKPIGQGNYADEASDELLGEVEAAYRDAIKGSRPWNGRDFYVSFGENNQRNWDEAVDYGFISAGGGEWYSRTLRQLEPGHRVFAYIPKGNGVGGYVGVGRVTGNAMLARDFKVQDHESEVPFLDVTTSPEAGDNPDDPALAEWIVPVEWISTRSHENAIKDSDLFANQNSAVKLTHGYTLEQLARAFEVDP
jgi:hypothetical protein